jgi:hypothetical protein
VKTAEAERARRDRMALALHTDTDDCAFMFGRECDCGWTQRLEEAMARYADPTFPPPRDKDDDYA